MNSLQDGNKRVIEQFRANGGKIGGFSSLLLLHTTGAKSGQERITPVGYMPDGERLIIIASQGGAPTNPDWYYNVQAHPLVTVEVGAEKFQAQATITREPERSQLYDKMAALMPSYDGYRHRTTRVIPVIALTPLK